MTLPVFHDGLQSLSCAAIQTLHDAGYTAYWAGGCVRDLLLNTVPKDYDIATNATPEQVITLFPDSILVGKSFGVTRVPIGKQAFEIATFRHDAEYRDGRHPDAVVFSDPQTDAFRRDFTVNALFYDPLSKTLFDYVQGYPDLGHKVIRAVGEPSCRFEEDHLRMLRAVRFACRLEFSIDPLTAQAITDLAHLLPRISAERIREELTRCFMEAQRPGQVLLALEELGLLAAILPEMAALRGQEQPPEYHPEGDVLNHTVIMLNRLRMRSPRLIWSVLFHDLGKPQTARRVNGRWRFENHASVGAELAQNIMERLRFSRDDSDDISAIVGRHMRFQSIPEMRRSTLRSLVGNPLFPVELELHRLDCEASHGNLAHYDFLLSFQNTLTAEPILPPPWVRGGDIMALGIAEGPRVGYWRQKAYEMQLEGSVANREALLEWLSHAVLNSTPKNLSRNEE